MRAAACLLAVALLLCAGAARAQSASTLASNTGQSNTGDSEFHLADYAQRVITGTSTHGWKLTSVKLKIHSVAGTTTYSVQIRNDASGNPGTTTLGTLTNPASLSTGLNTFSAPGTGIDLDASTSYWVLLDVDTSGGSPSPKLDVTSSDHEDSGSVWIIANISKYQSPGGTTWTGWASSLQLTIEGFAKSAPVSPRQARRRSRRLRSGASPSTAERSF